MTSSQSRLRTGEQRPGRRRRPPALQRVAGEGRPKRSMHEVIGCARFGAGLQDDRNERGSDDEPSS